MTTSDDDRPPDRRVMTVSERSLDDLADRLQDWLAHRLGERSGLTVSGVRTPSNNGLSSTSLLFEADWHDESGAGQHGAFVARLAPEADAVPVFPRYDLTTQFDVIAAVAEHSAVPVPALRWNEPDAEPLGSPFFVMDQVEGQIPLDNPPYVFGGWLLEATAAERSQLQHRTVEALVGIHEIADPLKVFPRLRPPPGEDALRSHVHQQRQYYRWALASGGLRVPIIERSLDWLDEPLAGPDRPRRPVLG